MHTSVLLNSLPYIYHDLLIFDVLAFYVLLFFFSLLLLPDRYEGIYCSALIVFVSSLLLQPLVPPISYMHVNTTRTKRCHLDGPFTAFS